MRRLTLAIAALFLGAIPAVAQTAGPAVEIVDFIGSRYGDGGQSMLIIEFRNFSEAPDPSGISITSVGRPQ